MPMRFYHGVIIIGFNRHAMRDRLTDRLMGQNWVLLHHRRIDRHRHRVGHPNRHWGWYTNCVRLGHWYSHSLSNRHRYGMSYRIREGSVYWYRYWTWYEVSNWVRYRYWYRARLIYWYTYVDWIRYRSRYYDWYRLGYRDWYPVI